MLNYKFLTSYVTDMNYITHRRFFVHLYQPIHWYLPRILTFLSEQRAPISTMFASRAFHNVLWSQHSNVQVSIFVTCLNFAGTGSRLWQLYVALWHDIWRLQHLAAQLKLCSQLYRATLTGLIWLASIKETGHDFFLVRKTHKSFQKQGKMYINRKKQQNPCKIAQIMKKKMDFGKFSSWWSYKQCF